MRTYDPARKRRRATGPRVAGHFGIETPVLRRKMGVCIPDLWRSPPPADPRDSASFSQAAPLNVSEVARDVGVDRKTAAAYFDLLEDL